MQILEWSDTRVRFKVKEIENNSTSDLDLTQYTKYKLEIRFSDDSLLEIDWVVDSWTIYFDIFWEYTIWKSGSIKADIRWVKDLKKVRFNPSTIKWKILSSVHIPNVM